MIFYYNPNWQAQLQSLGLASMFAISMDDEFQESYELRKKGMHQIESKHLVQLTIYPSLGKKINH